MNDVALLLVAHGTPDSIDQIPAFLNNIRRGRPTPAEIVEEVQRRYTAIGGRSPLVDTTRQQAELLSGRIGLPCFVAMRMWHPYMHEVLEQAAAQGVRKLVSVVMAPHSAFVYEQVLRESAAKLAANGTPVPELVVAPCIGSEPALLDAFASLIRDQLSALDPRELARTVLIPSAHSLPMRVVEAGDPYPTLVAETAQGVIARLGNDALPAIQAFQSQGFTGEPWLGPDLPTVFQRAKQTGATSVLVAPVGFLAEHVETLYDLDIEAKAIAAEQGLVFRRTPCPGTHSGLIDALEAVVRKLL
ncbi:MAG: ferrochelatase [Deltaproteobacteria bacterium]|nr:ferrochelatase [Deltaproteobacteria bacterium]